MATAISFIILFPLFFHFFSASWEDEYCRRGIPCGQLGNISYPFTIYPTPDGCGPFEVSDCDKRNQKIRLGRETAMLYKVESISQGGPAMSNVSITDTQLQEDLNYNKCESFRNLSLPHLPYASFTFLSNRTTLFKCNRSADSATTDSGFDSVFSGYSHEDCPNFRIYYHIGNYNASSLSGPQPNCSILQLPLNTRYSGDDNNIFRMLTASFSLQVSVHRDCYDCHFELQPCPSGCFGGKKEPRPPGPPPDGYAPTWPPPEQHKGSRWKLGAGVGCSAVLLIILVLVFCLWHRYKRKGGLPANTSRLLSKSDMETSNIYFGVSIFTYTELEQATNNFASENELGDGGFGTVYYGKLPDGREVAVKRLYERNYRKVQQFLNEIEILTRLRHKNLVSLYGCTSRHSRELLLVYEYIPNGTVADHLHGDQAISSPLTWPIRMRIAIETATALVYLHASDVIHRDVKTNNILLDDNFCVKVADFGISRLFPIDVTHISTAPQGTPGYVDPEYYQCYQLTDKSDVYSFGVVLVELISSMPAVDITRHRHEINLANLALNKIQRCEFDELIHPALGYQTDEEVKRMTTCVAELAFLCLQPDKEMRPPMEEVLEELKRIERREYESLESQEEEHNDA